VPVAKLNGSVYSTISKIKGVTKSAISKVNGIATLDPNTISLLHMRGTDGSTSFIDETGKTWTANGNAQIDTAITSPFGDNNGVGLFDGTGDSIESADGAYWRLDGGSNSNAWTWENRLRFNGDPGTAIVGFAQQRADDNNFWAIRLFNNLFEFIIRSGGVNTVVSSKTWNPATATWYHAAIVKNGTSGYMHFIDGVQVGTTTVDADPIPDFAAPLIVGDYLFGGVHSYFNGAMKEQRISDVARWTSNFTPPPAEY